MCAVKSQLPSQALGLAVAGILTAIGVGAMMACVGEAEKVNTAETNLCAERAGWKVVAAAAGGVLDPAAGSPRAKLEAAEDALCALVPSTQAIVTPPTTKDAGP